DEVFDDPEDEDAGEEDEGFHADENHRTADDFDALYVDVGGEGGAMFLDPLYLVLLSPGLLLAVLAARGGRWRIVCRPTWSRASQTVLGVAVPVMNLVTDGRVVSRSRPDLK